jgi:hypothetical protein
MPLTPPAEPGAEPPAPAPGSPRGFASLYCPASERREFRLLLALEAELGAGIARRLDHALAHARLDWWDEEAARASRGTARHPWLRAGSGACAARPNLGPLVHAARVDLAEGQHGSAAPRHLRGAIFGAMAQLLAQPPPDASEQSALESLGALSAELEAAPASAAPEALQHLRHTITQLAPPRQRDWMPLLVWCALDARRARAGEARSRWAQFADNIVAWRVARAALAGRLSLDT